MRAGLVALLQDLFKIRPDELRRTGYAFVYLFAAIGAFIIGRIARTVFFLEMPNYKEALPLAYIGTAIAVSTAMALYARFERKLRRDRTNMVTLAALLVITLAFRFAVHGGGAFVPWAFYFWVEVYGTFLVVQFWSFASEIFHARQAKRLFAVIGGGGVLANVAIGLAISNSVKSLGTENLLYLVSACLAVCLVMVTLLGREAKTELTAAHDRVGPGTRSAAGAVETRKVFATRHVQLIALVVVITYLVSTLVDYQFQAILGDSIPTKDERSAFLGKFYAYTGVIAGGIQFFLTSRILERFGLLVALLLLPITMLSGASGLLAVPLVTALAAITFTKGAENCLRYTVNDSTLQLLYLPLPAQLRGRAKTVIDGILKPLSIGVAGFGMALAMGSLEPLLGFSLGFKLEASQLGWAVAGGLVCWITMLLGLRHEYVKSLLMTLQKRRLNFADARFTIADEQTIAMLNRSLASDKLGEVIHALELLPFVSQKGRAGLAAKTLTLFQHPAHEVRVAALTYLRRSGSALRGEDVVPLLDDASAEVRAAAVQTLAAIERERSIQRADHLLADPDVRVRAAAVAGFVRYAGLDGVLASADRLKSMLGSQEPAEREHAAWILGEVGVQTFYQPLVPLFDDANEKVRLAAIDAAGRLRTPELIGPLTRQLERVRLRGAVVHALAQLGAAGEEVAVGLLADTNKAPAVRAQGARILARQGGSRAMELLSRHLFDPSGEVRTAVVQGMVTVFTKSPGVRHDAKLLDRALTAEARTYYEALAWLVDLAPDEQTLLLADALEHRQRQSIERVLLLLSLRYPAATMDAVARSLQSTQAATRANSVEVLDNLLTNHDKAVVLPLVDDAHPERRLAKGIELFGIERKSRELRLAELLHSQDTWLAAVATLATGTWGLAALEPQVRSLVDSPSPMCRETALVVLEKLATPHELRTDVQQLTQDPAPSVRRYAQHLLTRIEASPS